MNIITFTELVAKVSFVVDLMAKSIAGLEKAHLVVCSEVEEVALVGDPAQLLAVGVGQLAVLTDSSRILQTYSVPPVSLPSAITYKIKGNTF